MKPGIDHVGITIVFVCHDGNGNILLNKRSENARDEHGRWDCGAGKLEFGHSVINTLKREIKEEYCTDVLEHEFLGYRELHREHNGRKTHWISLDFKVRVDPEKVDNGEPHKFDEVGWFPLDDLPEPRHSQFPIWLEKYRDRL